MVLLFTTVVIAATIISLLAIFALIAITKQSAFGDGLTQEQLTASLGNRKADLLIKMNPPVVTTETLQNGQKPIVEFRLFDPTTNQTFNHVTYYFTERW
jgi:type II secretory pathway pseudopilin PulG